MEATRNQNMLARILRHLALAAVPFALACSSSGPTEISYETTTSGIQAGYVAVSTTSAGLVVVNQTELPVYYFAVERGTSALIDWVPCGGTSLALCVGISPGATLTIPWTNVVGYKPEASEYLLIWYHLVTVNGVATATGMQSVVVKR